MAAMPLPGDGEVPEWVHLLPSGSDIRTFDGRGPYRVTDPAAVVAASINADRLNGDLPVDENHSTDLRGPQGGEAPARGWIKELQARSDGIWGRVEWTGAGKSLIADRAYRGISPVFLHEQDGRVIQILRAALTNQPNLRGLAAINQESPVSFIEELRAKLGLPDTAVEADVVAAVVAKPAEATLQSQIAEIGAALGVTDGDVPSILTAARSHAKAQPAELVALQTELTALASELNALKAAGKRQAAEAYVDAAIREVRAGVKPQRERFITMHMADPAGTEALISGLPALGTGGAQAAPPTGPAGEIVALNAEQASVAHMLGISEEAYLKTLKAERGQKETSK